MGCIQSGKGYFEVKNSEEQAIRLFEKEIGSFSIDFRQLQQKLIINPEKVSIPTVKRVVEQELCQGFYKVILENSYFTIEDTTDKSVFYNSNKVLALLFLLTAPSLINNQFTYYYDKAYYLFLKSKEDDSDDLNLGIEKNTSLISFFKLLVEISCVYFPSSYQTLKRIPASESLKNFSGKLDEITNFLIDDLFTIKGKKENSISFDELKNKFSSNSYYLTSGYIREMGFEYLKTLNK